MVVPVYNHLGALRETARRLAAFPYDVYFVDDGCTDGSSSELDRIAAENLRFHVIHRARNGGKGLAVVDGARAAVAAGFTHAVQIDADGQHNIEDLLLFIRASEHEPSALVLGAPIFDDSAPKARLWGREISNVLSRLQTRFAREGAAPVDVLCGYRCYPLRELLVVAPRVGARMDFDIDVLVRLSWRGVPIRNVPTKVTYPSDGVSHFRYLGDNISLIGLHTRLLLQAATRPFRRSSVVTGPRWTRAAERGSEFWVRFLFTACRLMGRRFCNALAYPATAYFVAANSAFRRSSRDYFVRLRGRDCSGVALADVYRHCLAFSHSLIDRVAVWSGQLGDVECRWHGRDEVRARLASGRGVVMLSAHVGSVEICRALGSDLPHFRLHALMYTEHAARYNRILKEVNADAHVRVIPVENVGPELIFKLRERLEDGDCVGILGDRVLPSSSEKRCAVDFLGSPADFPAGPFILASLLECPVFFVVCLRAVDGSYDVHFELFDERIELPRQGREGALLACVQRYASRLEHYVRKEPYQWFNFYDFWERGDRTPETRERSS
ncbi:MAG: glycosyltransferase family 2 protein [Deltaproteobacteria bacterium]|nr:glycosyltransferase family 2 protein [Deltaproteobacteria bacterium]